MGKRFKKRQNYCPEHQKIVDDSEVIVKRSREGRRCAIEGCKTILSSYNRGLFCRLHHRRIIFEASGLFFNSSNDDLE